MISRTAYLLSLMTGVEPSMAQMVVELYKSGRMPAYKDDITKAVSMRRWSYKTFGGPKLFFKYRS